MMTDHPVPLTKPKRPQWGEPGSKAKRVTAQRIWSGGKSRAIVITIYPDVLSTRELGTRKEFFSDIVDIHRRAVVRTKAAEKEAKRLARKGKL